MKTPHHDSLLTRGLLFGGAVTLGAGCILLARGVPLLDLEHELGLLYGTARLPILGGLSALALVPRLGILTTFVAAMLLSLPLFFVVVGVALLMACFQRPPTVALSRRVFKLLLAAAIGATYRSAFLALTLPHHYPMETSMIALSILTFLTLLTALVLITRPTFSRTIVSSFAAFGVLSLTSGVLLACSGQSLTSLLGVGPPAVVGKETYALDEARATFDHEPLDRLLKSHVKDGLVDYANLKKEQKALERYVSSLAKAPFKELSRDGKLAFLINAYNACTLLLIVENFPLKSIKDIAEKDRWDARRFVIASETLSLNDIEHRKIRRDFQEPRIHWALVCAAMGCPPLRNEAYVGTRLESQLADQDRIVHSDARWLSVSDGKIRATRLYEWYGKDFPVVRDRSLLAWLITKNKEVKAAAAKGATSVEWIPYDWDLNAR